MAATLNNGQAITTPTTVGPAEITEGIRLARYCELEETVGLVYGVITVAYVLTLLTGLAPEARTDVEAPANPGFHKFFGGRRCTPR
jgi:hypothetical protein